MFRCREADSTRRERLSICRSPIPRPGRAFRRRNLKADAVDGADKSALAAKQVTVREGEIDLEVADIQQWRSD